MNSPYTAQQRAEFEAVLRQRRQQISAHLQAQLGGHSRVEHAREWLLQDGDDAPQRDADREVDQALSDRDMVALAEIDAALARLASGPYGRCQACGEPIAAARLRLAPQALLCLSCAERQERGRPRPATL